MSCTFAKGILILVYFTDIIKTQSCIFCRDKQVGVVFYPFVSIEDVNSSNRYNVSNLQPLISTIYTEFSTVTIPFHISTNKYIISGSNSLKQLPIAVATWNQAKSSMSYKINALLLIKIDSNLTFVNHNDEFKVFKHIIQAANLISTGTVTKILLQTELANLDAFALNRMITQLEENFPKPDYTLGVVWSLNEFEGSVQKLKTCCSGSVFHVLKRLQHLYFKIETCVNEEFVVDIHILVQRLITLMDYKINFIRNNVTTSMSFGLIVSCPDTNTNGIISYSRFVKFRTTLYHKLKPSNVTVIFYNAFDIMSILIDQWADYPTSGWWRLKQNASYTKTSDYVFQNKIEIDKRENSKSTSQLLAELEQEVEFDQINVFASLSTTVAPFYYRIPRFYSFEVFSSLLETVASKFSNLNYMITKDNRDNWKVPEMIAQYNVNFNRTLNLILGVSVWNQESLEIAVQRAQKTNEIFPGTVKQLLAYIPIEHGKKILQYLRYLLQQHNSTRNIQVGLLISTATCAGTESTFYQRGLEETLTWPDFVYFQEVVSMELMQYNQVYHSGVDRIVLQLKARFTNCKRRIDKIVATNVSIGLWTYFSYISEDEFGPVSLVRFWREMNLWANSTNFKVILVMAYQLPMMVNSNYRTGWWTAFENGNDSAKIKLVETRKVALKFLRNRLESENKSRSSSNLDNRASWIIALIVIFAVALISLGAILIVKRTGLLKYKPNRKVSVSNEIVILAHTAFNKETSTFVGAGNFGMVFRCYMPEFDSEVAVKTISDSSVCIKESDDTEAIESLLSEIKIMSRMGQHVNLLRILGVCQENALFIVMEYCQNGSLFSYLRSQSEEMFPLTKIYELLNFCTEVANGLGFLHEKNIIHGDLSARNILLDEHKTCKISDFGLSRNLGRYEVYTKKADVTLPWRWMALEVLKQFEFSLKADIWSLGITFWEIYSFGNCPYANRSWDDAFIQDLANGYRLDKPNLMDDTVYQILLSCWNDDRMERPSIVEILDRLCQLKQNEYTSVVG